MFVVVYKYVSTGQRQIVTEADRGPEFLDHRLRTGSRILCSCKLLSGCVNWLSSASENAVTSWPTSLIPL